MKRTRMVAVIALIVMLMAAVPAFAAPDPGEGNTDVIVTNTNQNTGAPAAQVTAIYYNPSGGVEYNQLRTINSRGSYNFRAAAAQLGDNWQGSMVVQSDAELAAVAEIHWTGGSFSDGKEADAYTGYAQGATEVYFPFVVWAPATQFSTLTVQNTEASEVTIQMTYTNRNGTPDFVNVTSTIPAFGSKIYAMNQPGVNGVPDLRTTTYYQQNSNWTGAVKISAQGGKKIAAVASNNWLQYSMAYNGLVRGASSNYLPTVERRLHPTQGWRGQSTINAQCLATTPCTVVIDYVNAATQQIDLTLPPLTVAPGAAIGANTRSGGSYPANLFADELGDTWTGSAIVRSTNGTNLGVIAQSIRPGNNETGGTSAATSVDAGIETFLPVIYQKNTQSVSCPSSDSAWTTFSRIMIQNPGTSNATNVDIYYFNLDGSQAFQDLDRQIQAGKSFNRNTRVNCSEIPLNGNWTGSVYIRSDQPLVAAVENFWGDFEMVAYNGYSITR